MKELGQTHPFQIKILAMCPGRKCEPMMRHTLFNSAVELLNIEDMKGVEFYEDDDVFHCSLIWGSTALDFEAQVFRPGGARFILKNLSYSYLIPQAVKPGIFRRAWRLLAAFWSGPAFKLSDFPTSPRLDEGMLIHLIRIQFAQDACLSTSKKVKCLISIPPAPDLISC